MGSIMAVSQVTVGSKYLAAISLLLDEEDRGEIKGGLDALAAKGTKVNKKDLVATLATVSARPLLASGKKTEFMKGF